MGRYVLFHSRAQLKGAETEIEQTAIVILAKAGIQEMFARTAL